MDDGVSLISMSHPVGPCQRLLERYGFEVDCLEEPSVESFSSFGAVDDQLPDGGTAPGPDVMMPFFPFEARAWPSREEAEKQVADLFKTFLLEAKARGFDRFIYRKLLTFVTEIDFETNRQVFTAIMRGVACRSARDLGVMPMRMEGWPPFIEKPFGVRAFTDRDGNEITNVTLLHAMLNEALMERDHALKMSK